MDVGISFLLSKVPFSVCYVLSRFCFCRTSLAQVQNLCLVFQVMVIYYGYEEYVMRSYISHLGLNKAIYVKIKTIS
jgi:hypothetical protein